MIENKDANKARTLKIIEERRKAWRMELQELEHLQDFNRSE